MLVAPDDPVAVSPPGLSGAAMYGSPVAGTGAGAVVCGSCAVHVRDICDRNDYTAGGNGQRQLYAYRTMGGYGVRIQQRMVCSVGSKAMRLYGLRFGVHGGSGTLDRKV